MNRTHSKKIVTGRKKRIGRGTGSGKGMHTVGKGQKGQKSRAGYHLRKGFHGDKNTLIVRLPRFRGAENRSKSAMHKKHHVAVRITTLLEKGIYTIDVESIQVISQDAKTYKLVGSTDYGEYELSKVHVKTGIPVSVALKERIVAAGGKVEE